MAKDKDYVTKAALGTVIVSSALGLGFQSYLIIEGNNPHPTVYRDVNGDGVDDKIIQRTAEKKDFFGQRIIL